MIQIVGAGIIGLTTAIVLTSRGYKVRIIHDSTSLYASSKAGAHFRPVSTEEGLMRNLEKDTFQILDKLTDLGIGIQYADGEEYHNENFELSWLPIEFISKKGYKLAISYKQFVINVPRHLDFLRNQLLQSGVDFIDMKIQNFAEFTNQNPNDIFINCSGFDAGTLVKDPMVFPIRGQTVLVDAPLINKSYFAMNDGSPVYAIPRGDGTVILGGTFKNNDPSTVVDDATTDRIISGCTELFGINFNKIISVQVGIRPGRELIKISRDANIIHNYGHGPCGWQTSYGSAFQVLRLIQDLEPIPGQHFNNFFMQRLDPLINAKL